MFSFLSFFASAQSLKLADFDDRLKSTKNSQLIDVRRPEEFREGHLKGAVNMDVNAADFVKRIAKLDTSRAVFVYCRSGRRSKAALKVFKDAGFTTVYELDGGILSWKAAGRPME